MSDPTLVDHLVGLSRPEQRPARARALADALGVEEILLLVRDPELGGLLPAPGFPQTLRGGPRWRKFLEDCGTSGRSSGEVDLPRGRLRPALGVACPDAVLVALGGTVGGDAIDLVEGLLPLLGRQLDAEQRTALAEARAAEAAERVSRARHLARALEAARAELSRLNLELRKGQQRRDDFLAMLGHELRNPLTPLVTSAELLRRRSHPPETAVQLEVMGRQIEQLSRLVEDLLDVSRVSRGRVTLRRQPVLLRETVDAALETVRPTIDAHSLRAEVSFPDEPLWVDGDRVRLIQIFTNLIDNAAKYTGPGGTVRVALRRKETLAEVRVEDTGIGIPAEELPYVFDLFSQAPVSLDRTEGGLGIGLTLVRSLVELHGGEVEAASEGPGTGTTFVVRLPTIRPSVRSDGAGLPETNDAPPAAPRARALRVLVVDDNRDAADGLAELLRLLGHRAEATYGGLTALQLVEDLDPDLVLLDIGLPELDGFEVARRIRRLLGDRVRLVAVTGYGSAEDRRRSREAGFDEHVVKPVDVDLLEQIVQRESGPGDG